MRSNQVKPYEFSNLSIPIGMGNFLHRIEHSMNQLDMVVTATSNDMYRFGFNGKENDNEIKGDGNSLDFGARIYDSRLGRWLSLDPLMAKYPDLSPYNFVANNPILFVDKDGKEIWIYDPDNISAAPVIFTPNMKVPENASNYTQDAINGLNFLYNNGVDKNGINRVGDLVKAKNVLHVKQPMEIGMSKYRPVGSMGPESGTLFFENRVADNYGDGIQSALIGLAHDLDHAHKSILAADEADKFAMTDPKMAVPWGVATMAVGSKEELIQKYEKPAMGYESEIGDLSIDGNKLSTFKRTEYTEPQSIFLTDSIFSTKPTAKPDPALQKRVDVVNESLKGSNSK